MAPDERVAAFTVIELRRRAAKPAGYSEFLRRDSFSCGIYELPAGATDPQYPHREDELYVVLRGRATLSVGDSVLPVARGSIMFVAAGVPHRFVDIEDHLTVLVLFAPPETS